MYVLNCFRVHLVSKMGSHSTKYTMIVCFTCVRWPEDGHRLKYVAILRYQKSYTIVMFLTE
jgi:hypothetical protein